MPKSEPSHAQHAAKPAARVADYLHIPEDRRAAAEVSAATLLATAQRVADELPLGADVDDFRRVLVAEA